MTQLVVDVGNSRIKCAEWRDGTLGPVITRAHEGCPASVLEAILAPLAPHQVVMADVTGETLECAQRLADVILVVATAEAFGVRNAYGNPGLLGADRWAALVAARAITTEAVCVVDAGSALTVDLLDASGQHLGGWIMPGLRATVQALSTSTRQVRVDSGEFKASIAPGRTTEEAVCNGAMNAVLGLVERALQQHPSKVLLTGGDAESLSPFLTNAAVVPGLVLYGLARWAAKRPV